MEAAPRRSLRDPKAGEANINGEMHYLWRAVDQEGKVLVSYVTRTRDKKAALRVMKKALKRHGSPAEITTDGLRSYMAAMNELGNAEKQEVTLGQQPGGAEPPAVPATRASPAQVPTDEEPTEVRLGPRQRPQSLQPRTPPD